MSNQREFCPGVTSLGMTWISSKDLDTSTKETVDLWWRMSYIGVETTTRAMSMLPTNRLYMRVRMQTETTPRELTSRIGTEDSS
jgi:hypothetical protein